MAEKMYVVEMEWSTHLQRGWGDDVDDSGSQFIGIFLTRDAARDAIMTIKARAEVYGDGVTPRYEDRDIYTFRDYREGSRVLKKSGAIEEWFSWEMEAEDSYGEDSEYTFTISEKTIGEFDADICA